MVFNNEANEFWVQNPYPRPVSEWWPQLSDGIDIGFTVEPSIYGNPIAGHTIFVKDNTLYEFNNTVFVSSGSIEHWLVGKSAKLWRYVATTRNSSLVLINVKTALAVKSSGKTLYFDNAFYPESMNQFHALRPNIPWNHLKSLFPMTDSDKYMALMSVHGNGFYCIMDTLRSNCNYKPIHGMFNCSSNIILLKQNDWIYWVWLTTRLNTHEMLLVISGAMVSAFLIQCLLFTISLNRYLEIS